MSKHTQNAIEAIFETAPVGCTIRDAERIYLAALPHLRAMIAEEIRDANLPNDPVFYSGAEGYHLGIKAAARIAQGAPRD